MTYECTSIKYTATRYHVKRGIICLSQFKRCSCCVSISVSVSSDGVLAARAYLSQSVHAVFLLREHHQSQSIHVVFLLREHLCLSQFRWCSCCVSISVSVSSNGVLAARASSVSVSSNGVLAAQTSSVSVSSSSVLAV